MENILFTRQFHRAEKAGDHYDYRLVVGDKAHSWATKKQLPEPGKSIILWEQPVHTSHYALSERVEIPSGQYGAGVTTLDWVKKGKASFEDDKIVVDTDSGKFLIKKMPETYGNGAWLFKHLEKEKNMENKYLNKISSDLAIAEKSRSEEEKAIRDYTKRLEVADNPILQKAIEHARKEEKDHAEDFEKAKVNIEKSAVWDPKDYTIPLDDPTNKYSIHNRVKKVVGSTLNLDPAKIKSTHNLIKDLKISKVDRYELLMNLEEEFSKEIPDEVAPNLHTVQHVINYFSKEMK